MKGLFFDNSLFRIALLNITSKIYRKAALLPLSPTQYGEVAEPEIPNARWLKIKNRACGICGSDIHFIFMEMDPKCFPAATPGLKRKFLGHELVGEVIETGSEVSNVKVGDRVSMRIDWPSCYQMEIEPMCNQCASGNYMLCENLGKRELPVNVGGGFSPVMVMHRTQPYRIPEALSDDEALLLEPVASTVHGVLKRLPRQGERVLVIGCGTIGLLTIRIIRALVGDVDICALARYPFQAEKAQRMGAGDVLLYTKEVYREISRISGGRYLEGYFGNRILLGGFDMIIDSVGNDRSIHDALRWIRGGGSLVIVGINFRPGTIDYTPIWNQEITVTGINCHATESTGETSFDIAARLLQEKRIPVEEFITHRFPMRRYRDAISVFLSKGRHCATKIVLEHE